MTDSEPRNLRVFLAHAERSDPVDVKEVLRRLEITWEDALVISGRERIVEAIRSRIEAADAFIAILDGRNANVLLELGLAIGLGKPTVLVASDMLDVPDDLSGSIVVDRKIGLSTLGDILDRAMSASTSNRPETVTLGPAITADQADGFKVRFAAQTRSELLNAVTEMLGAAGATVVASPSPNDVGTPDLVVWQEGLHSLFGLPLPVEVLVRTHSLNAVVPRLRRTLVAAGARSLIALVAQAPPANAEPHEWADRSGRFILAAPLALLADELTQHSLPEAFAEIRGLALPNRMDLNA